MKGTVYIIKHKYLDIVYVGSTVLQLARRRNTHRLQYKKWLDGNNTCCAIFKYFKEYGFENFEFKQIEKIKYLKDKNELYEIEQKYIEYYKSCSNCVNVSKANPAENKHNLTDPCN